MEKLFLYLARRDKKTIKMLNVSEGSCLPCRVTDLRLLALPFPAQQELEGVIFSNRMEWEPWIESAESYEALRDRLLRRGFKQLPISQSPGIIVKNAYGVTPDTSKLSGQQTMMQPRKF